MRISFFARSAGAIPIGAKMSKLGNVRTSVSAMMGLPVVDSAGKPLGRVCEFAVSPNVDACHVEALVLTSASPLALTGRDAGRSMLPIGGIHSNENGRIEAQPGAASAPMPEGDSYLLLERDLLDQQIIDVHGHKVVRVNDVELVWEPLADGTLTLRIAEVEVGMRGAIRRLFKGLPATTVERLASRIKISVIPWDFVDLIDRDPARRVRLKIEQDRLSKMHPSDLADILEELAPSEREALFSSLDEEVAAEALEEVEPKMQRKLLESLDSERIAGIVEEMDPGAAADLLSELSEERSDAILEEMDPEERHEVEELLEFAGDSAAGRMTTDYISLPSGSSSTDALTAMREFEGHLDTITEIYLVDERDHLSGVIPLGLLVLAPAGQPLAELPHGHLISCQTDTPGKKVAELFDKYNLRSLPVLDRDGRLAGVIHAEQVIAMLRSGRR
jgi:magnesium transporter